MIKEINLLKISDPRGNLTFFENNNQIPFSIKRTYWIYDVSGGESRAGNAFKESKEFIIAISGSFDVETFQGQERKVYKLSRPYKGLYLPNLTWRNITNFSTNSVALIVSSSRFNREDYIRDYEIFKNLSIEKD